MKKHFSTIFTCYVLMLFTTQAQQLTITTDSILQTSTCAGGNVAVRYTVSGGNFNVGNVFTAQLSDGLGQFTNPVNIGALIFSTSGVILATIPQNTNFGFLYKIRVIANHPSDTGTVCPNTLIITHIAQLNQIIPFPGDTICQGDSTSLSILNLSTSYLWSTGETTPSIIVNQAGIYSVTTVDLLGCQSTAYDTVFEHICAGIEENDLSRSLLIYPNPTDEMVFIKIPDNFLFSGISTITISDINGRLLINQTIHSEKTKINITDFAKGVYILKLSNDENTEVIRFVKE